jgi:hypothetical protein
MIRKLIPGILALLLVTTGAFAGSGKWLHVAVDEGGENGERVRINLPLDLVESILPLIEVDEFHGGKVRIDHHDLEDIDIAGILAAVRDAEDGEYVTVEDGDETVRVAKEGNRLIVKVEDEDDPDERVMVNIRMELIDAMVSAEEEGELDVLAAVRLLSEHEDGFFVNVVDDDETVRIWIDSKSTID